MKIDEIENSIEKLEKFQAMAIRITGKSLPACGLDDQIAILKELLQAKKLAVHYEKECRYLRGEIRKLVAESNTM